MCECSPGLFFYASPRDLLSSSVCVALFRPLYRIRIALDQDCGSRNASRQPCSASDRRLPRRATFALGQVVLLPAQWTTSCSSVVWKLQNVWPSASILRSQCSSKNRSSLRKRHRGQTLDPSVLRSAGMSCRVSVATRLANQRFLKTAGCTDVAMRADRLHAHLPSAVRAEVQRSIRQACHVEQ